MDELRKTRVPDDVAKLKPIANKFSSTKKNRAILPKRRIRRYAGV